MTVIRDCTGTYLRHYDKDYQVYNSEVLASFPHDAIVNAAFRRTDKYTVSACYLYHKSEGFVIVTEVE